MTTKDTIKFQYDIASQLLDYHLKGISSEECYFKPFNCGLSINRAKEGFAIDWPTSESYDIGPPNIAWILWHISYWWSMALDHNFGDAMLKKDDIKWAGTADKAVVLIKELQAKWTAKLDEMSEEDYAKPSFSKWPFEGKSFAELAAWLNLELMKNASELGYSRFVYAAAKEK